MNPTKFLIAGWDGATWEQLLPLVNAGKLPTLQKLMQRGSYGQLTSVIPPISAAAWVTVLTGVTPIQHGVFDFRNLDLRHPTARQERLTSSASYSQLPTLFDYLGENGCIAYQIPLTYPPRPVHGVLVAGYPTPHPQQAYTYPPEWAERLTPLPALTADRLGCRQPLSQQQIFRRYVPAFTDQLITLSQSVNWQLLFFVNGAIDGAQHHFFKYTLPHYPGVTINDQQRYKHLLAEVIQLADAELGRLLTHLPNDLNILLISDHDGRQRPIHAIHINAWLRQQGWLAVKKSHWEQEKVFWQQSIGWAKERLPITDWVKQYLPVKMREKLASWRAGTFQIDWSQTQAYRVKLSYPFEGIHLYQPNQPVREGVLDVSLYSLREKIIFALRQLPQIAAVYPREQLGNGAYLSNLPHIICQLQSDYDGGDGLQELQTQLPASWLQRINGYHDMKGIWVAAGPSFRQGQGGEAQLTQILPTILYGLGLEMPAHLPDPPLTHLFQDPPPPLVTSLLSPVLHPMTTELTAEENAGMTDTLHRLGYL